MGKNRTRNPSMSIKGENVIGTINAGGHARVNVDQKVIHQSTPQLEKLFKRVHRAVQARPEDPKLGRDRLEDQVKRIEQEAAKGPKADKNRLEKWIRTLAKMAPDIVDVMAASLGGPVSGFTAVFKKIIQRAISTTTG